ncbi:peptidylprolyl isomerase [Bacteroidales bacterium OttesenSCG-928-K03]|nr:peptidylprolyl isomerase [Odoribacter sp. OttesenSCG-928-L07]MDL2239399.1 peptidylprolyl isomerase [Bacteroidales bacterium OttesenSCG-928-L14]MDL2240741.1 peptidylprolyl isomerase [Bacteroidales bacterium OttesenSCG-928-K22]MDL2242736.1 peptidylprolyl isomerase [Bacteroidales bacterium OttesenSCG-928-K03]
MAAIGKIRKYYVLCMVVIGVALLAFIIGDFSRSGTDPSERAVGVVDGEKISWFDFAKEVDINTNLRAGNTDPQVLSSMAFSIRESVWQDMVKQIILKKQTDELGVSVTTKELNDLIRGASPHEYIVSNFTNPETGLLDHEQLDYFLLNLNNPNVIPAEVKSNYLYIENLIKKETLESKYTNLISKGFYVPTAFALKDYNEKSTKYDVEFVAKRYRELPDSLFSASNAELQNYYNEHKEEYKLDETREVEFIEYLVTPTQEDRNNLWDDVNKLFAQFETTTDVKSFLAFESETPYNENWIKLENLTPTMASNVEKLNVGDFIPPFEENGKLMFAKIMDSQERADSLKASHILLSYQGSANAAEDITRTKEEAEAEAKRLLGIIKSSPNQFGALAAEYSTDASNAKNNGELGWFTDGKMVQPFNEFVVESKVGAIDIVESVFGYHIIKVEDKAAISTKYKLAEFSRSIIPSSATHTAAYFFMSDLAANVKNYDEMVAVAREKGLNVRPISFTKNSSGLPGRNNSRDVVRWTFDKNTKAGNVSKIFEYDGDLYVAALKSINDKGYRTLNQVENEIKPLVIRDKKAEVLLKELNDAKATSSNINTIATNLGVNVEKADISGNITNIPAYGNEPYVAGAMYGAPVDQLSGVVKGDQAVFIFTKKLKESPQEKTSDFAADQRRLENQTSSRLTRNAISVIEKNVKVENNTLDFY